MNILFTCVGRRTYLLKYFKEQLKGEGLIVGTDMQLSAPALSVSCRGRAAVSLRTNRTP